MQITMMLICISIFAKQIHDTVNGGSVMQSSVISNPNIIWVLARLNSVVMEPKVQPY
jgi:hypothetical protein